MRMNKYEIGDRVVIKPDVEATLPVSQEVVSMIKEYEGKEATIVQIGVNAFLGTPMYKLDIDNGGLEWDESVLAPAKLKTGNRVRSVNIFPEFLAEIKMRLTSLGTDSWYLIKTDESGICISVSEKNLQKISNPESVQNDKNSLTKEEEEIMITDYRVEDCTIFDKTSGQDKYIKGKRTILEWTDGTVTTVECPETEFKAYNGFAIALAKKAMGNDNTMTNIADYWINKLPAKNAKIQAEIEKRKAEERRIAEKRKAKKEKWQMRQAVLARKKAYEESQKQRAVAEIAEREFGVPIDFKTE